MKTDAFRWALFLALSGMIVAAFFYRDQLDANSLRQWIEGAGLAAPLLFIALYAMATVLFLPGTVMTLAGGALFGPLLGTLYNLVGAVIGAAMAFLIARYLAGGWVERKIGGGLKRIKEGVEKEGWRFVAFTRLVPVFPFNLINYGFGLTRVRFRDYTVASTVCMLPGCFAYSYLGYVGREAASGDQGWVPKALLALTLLVALALLPRIISRLWPSGAD